MTRTLLPLPGRPYLELVADLEARGWAWAGEGRRRPILPGEPEQVEWAHRDGGRISYTFDPAVHLRELRVDAAAPQVDALDALPQLRADDVAALLRADDEERAIRGLLAAQALGAVALIGLVRACRTHPRALVRELAERATRALEALPGTPAA